jgi:hypothetical protein
VPHAVSLTRPELESDRKKGACHWESDRAFFDPPDTKNSSGFLHGASSYRKKSATFPEDALASAFPRFKVGHQLSRAMFMLAEHGIPAAIR